MVVVIVVVALRLPVLAKLLGPGVVYVNQGITDFGRDLVGARAVEVGGSPYGSLGDLYDRYGAVDLPQSGPPRETGWVVHPPVAIAGARLLLTLAGLEQAELVARRLGAVGVGLLLVALFALFQGTSKTLAGVVAATLVMWVPTFTDLLWIQDNGVAGLLLLGVLWLDHVQRRSLALLLLGLLVAWKPWLAVFALGLPRSSSALKDLSAVAVTAIGATLLVLPFVGGWETLRIWVVDALPGNVVEARDTPSNISWTSFLTASAASVLYVIAVVGAALGRRFVDRDLWPLVAGLPAVTVAPFVWDHYWLAIVPAFAWAASAHPERLRSSFQLALGLAVIPVALDVFGLPGLENRGLPMALAPVPIAAGLALLVRDRRAGRRSGPVETGSA